MTRIYDNSSLTRRMNISAAVTILVVIYGLWELWTAAHADPASGGYGYFFAAAFIGGGIYGLRQLLTEYADMVVSLDAEGADGKGAVAVWRPFRAKRIEGGPDRLSEWRPYAKKTRNTHTPMLLADHPGYPRPLQFEIGKGVTMAPEFRALAGEALSSLENR